MTKSYALKRLLEHGPLTLGEAIDITGYGKSTVEYILGTLIDAGYVTRQSNPRGGYVYALTLEAA